MPFTSVNALVTSLTSGKVRRAFFQKSTGPSVLTAGRWYGLSGAGTPVANTWTGTALNAQAPDATATFRLATEGAVTPETQHVINLAAVATAATAVPGVLMLVDICLYYPGINMNIATLQTLVNTNTLTRYTTGEGLLPFLQIVTASGATAHNVAINYTNQAGTAGRTLPVTVACTASAIATHITHSGVAVNNYGPFMPLAAGDTGVRSVQSITISAASLGGTAALVLARPLATIPITAAGVLTERDLLNQLPSLPQVQDGSCLTWLYFPNAATAANSLISGHVETVWG